MQTSVRTQTAQEVVRWAARRWDYTHREAAGDQAGDRTGF